MDVTVSRLAGDGAQMKNLSPGAFRGIKSEILLGYKHGAVNAPITQSYQEVFIPTLGKPRTIKGTECPSLTQVLSRAVCRC